MPEGEWKHRQLTEEKNAATEAKTGARVGGRCIVPHEYHARYQTDRRQRLEWFVNTGHRNHERKKNCDGGGGLWACSSDAREKENIKKRKKVKMVQ